MDDDPIDADRFAKLIPATAPQAAVEEIDCERFRSLGQSKQDSTAQDFGLPEENLSRSNTLPDPERDSLQYVEGADPRDDPEDSRFATYCELLDIAKLPRGKVRYVDRPYDAEGMPFVTPDGFDSRLGEVIRLFRERYPLPIIVQCGVADGYSDRGNTVGRPTTDFYVFNAIAQRRTYGDRPSTREEALDDYLVACTEKVEYEIRPRVVDPYDPSDITSWIVPFVVGIREFCTPGESRLDEWAGVDGIRRYGFGDFGSASSRDAVATTVQAEARATDLEAVDKVAAAVWKENVLVPYQAPSVLLSYADKMLQSVQDYAERDAERKKRTYRVGTCEVVVGRNEEGGYYAFVRCDQCGWSTGAIYSARRPEDNTPEVAKEKGVSVANDHLLIHPEASQAAILGGWKNSFEVGARKGV